MSLSSLKKNVFHEQNSETHCESQGENSPKVDVEVLAVLVVNFSEQQASVVRNGNINIGAERPHATGPEQRAESAE